MLEEQGAGLSDPYPFYLRVFSHPTISRKWNRSLIFQQNNFMSHFLLENADSIGSGCSVGTCQCHQSRQRKPDICLVSLPAAQLAGSLGQLHPMQPEPIWSFFTLPLFYFYCISPPFSSLDFISHVLTALKSPVACQNIRCQIKVQVTL